MLVPETALVSTRATENTRTALSGTNSTHLNYSFRNHKSHQVPVRIAGGFAVELVSKLLLARAIVS